MSEERTISTLKVTPALRRTINAGVKNAVGGFSPLSEIGVRESVSDPGGLTPNELDWHKENDLCDLRRLSECTKLPTVNGRVILDLYVTTGRGDERQLDTNVAVLIENGKVIAVYDSVPLNAREHSAIEAGTALRRRWIEELNPAILGQ